MISYKNVDIEFSYTVLFSNNEVLVCKILDYIYDPIKFLLMSDITTLKQCSRFSCQNTNENMKLSADDKFLEKSSSCSLKVERLEI